MSSPTSHVPISQTSTLLFARTNRQSHFTQFSSTSFHTIPYKPLIAISKHSPSNLMCVFGSNKLGICVGASFNTFPHSAPPNKGYITLTNIHFHTLSGLLTKRAPLAIVCTFFRRLSALWLAFVVSWFILWLMVQSTWSIYVVSSQRNLPNWNHNIVDVDVYPHVDSGGKVLFDCAFFESLHTFANFENVCECLWIFKYDWGASRWTSILECVLNTYILF